MHVTEELTRGPRHKSSLNKQFGDETLSPVRGQKSLKLDYNTEMANAGGAATAKRYAGGKKEQGYVLSSLNTASSPNLAQGRFNTINHSPENMDRAYGNIGDLRGSRANAKQSVGTAKKPSRAS